MLHSQRKEFCPCATRARAYFVRAIVSYFVSAFAMSKTTAMATAAIVPARIIVISVTLTVCRAHNNTLGNNQASRED